jgi:hypothetical protein
MFLRHLGFCQRSETDGIFLGAFIGNGTEIFTIHADRNAFVGEHAGEG